MKQTRNKHSPAFEGGPGRPCGGRDHRPAGADLRPIPEIHVLEKGPGGRSPGAICHQSEIPGESGRTLPAHELKVERDFLSERSESRSIRRAMIDRDHQQLSLVRQCILLDSRASVYSGRYTRARPGVDGPDGPSVEDPLLRLQEDEGGCCNRAIGEPKKGSRLMRLMLEAIYRRPNTSKPARDTGSFPIC